MGTVLLQRAQLETRLWLACDPEEVNLKIEREEDRASGQIHL